MNESAGYKACLGVPNIHPENAIADCFADIQVSFIETPYWFVFLPNVTSFHTELLSILLLINFENIG